jgi:hypothetical protein
LDPQNNAIIPLSPAKRLLFPRMSMDIAASMPFLILLLKNLQLVTLLQVGLTK